MAAADYVTVVQQLYVAYFGRPADVEGLANFTAALDATGVPATAAGVEAAYKTDATVKALVDSFGNSDESAALYGSGNIEAFVIAIYANVLNRVPDKEGFDFWFNAINNGVLSKGNAALSIMAGALANTSVQGQADAALVNARITVATNFTTAITTENATYSGDAAAKAAREMLATVTADTDTTAFQSTIVSTLATITNPDAGSTFTLTNSATADTLVGTAKNDTFNGASGTVANADTIIDQSTTDNDTANLVVKAAYTPSNISNVENLNLDWDAFGTATYALTSVTGAKNVTLTSAKTGFLGSATVTGATGLTLKAGSGMVGTLTASGFKTGTVEGGEAKTLVVDGSATNADNASIVVNAGTSTTSVTVGATNGFKASTINAGTATTVAVTDTGNTTDTTDLTVNNAAVSLTADNTGAMSLTASDGNTVTMVTGGSVIGNGLTVKGDGDVTLVFAANDLAAETVTNSKTAGKLTIKSADTNGEDVSKVSADLIEFTAAQAGATTVKSGANLKYSGATGAINVTITGTGTSDVATAELTQSQTSVTLTGVETLNLTANATTTSGADLTIGTLALAGNKAVLSGTNDVALTSVTSTGTTGEVDATALAGDLTIAGTTASIAVKGGTGKLSLTSTGAATDISAVGQTSDDTVTANSVDAGSVTAILGDGKNTVSATALTTGTVVVTGGSGIDTVTAGAALTTGVINLSLGDGANVINLDDGAGAGTRVVTTGGGDDTLTFTGGLDDANDVLTWTAGAGTDTLVFATAGADISVAKVTLDGVEAIKVKADDDADATTATATIAAGDLTGKTYAIKADAFQATTSIAVKGEATASTIDLSALSIDQSITAAIARVYVDASANTTTAQTITGTAVADYITGGAKNDTIVAGNGADVITGGNGNDSIDVTETTANSAVDIIVLNAAGSGVDTITGFKSGTDQITLGNAATASAAGAAEFVTTAATVGAGVVFDISDVAADTSDVIEIGATLSSNGNLALGSDGTELLKALSSTTTAAASITLSAAANTHLVAYQNGDAYIYYASSADTTLAAGEITLVGIVKGITAGALVAADFIEI